MAREPDELVEMRRVLGAQLAAYRQAAALSQGQLAIATTVDRTTVTHIEKGRSRADERFWRIADDKCRAGGALLAGYRSWQAAKQQHDIRVTEANLADARARAESLRARHPSEPLTGQSKVGNLTADAPLPDAVTGQLARLLCGWIGAMNRRELLQLLGLAATAPPAVTDVLNPDEQERLGRAITAPERVDDQVIEHLETALHHCKRQNDALGPRAVLGTVLAQRNLVGELLAECPARLRSRLLSVYSDMSTSLAFYHFDLDDVDNARRYGDQARIAAQEANNVDFCIHAMSSMSYFASWQRTPGDAIGLAQAAQDLASGSRDRRIQISAAERAGTAYATDGRYDECMAEFERMDRLASAESSPRKSSAYFYNEEFLASKKSECLLRLGRPRAAAEYAREALKTFDSSFVSSQAFCTLRLGNAELRNGEIDQAASAVGDACGLAARTRSARLIKELHSTRARLQPWAHTQPVRTLDEMLHAHGLAPTP